MLFYVVVYDIPDDKRRQKIHDLLEGYGRWVQYSVFECVLTSQKYEDLQTRLQKMVKLDEDSVRFYPLSRHTASQVEIWGIGPPITLPPTSIVI